MSANRTWNQWARQAGRISLVAAIVATVAPISMRSSAQSTPSERPELVLQVGHTGAVNAIALSPDGRFLVSGCDDSTIKIWDLASGRVLRTLYGHDGPVRAVALTDDGRLIASGGQDGRVRVWDVATGSLRTLGAHRQRVTAVAFSTDARQLTSLGVAELKVWDVASARELRATVLIDEKDILATTMGDRRATALTPDGRLAAIGGGFSYRGGMFQFNPVRAQPIRVIEAATGREMQSFTLQGQFPMPTGLRFSRDGRLLVAQLFENSRAFPMPSSLVVYDVGSGRELRRLPSGAATLNSGIGFSPDGKLFASSGVTGTSSGVRLFDASTWQQVRELQTDDQHGPATSRDDLLASPLAWSGDGKLLALSVGEGVTVVDAATGSRVRALRTTEHRTALSSSPRSAAYDEMMRQSGADPALMREVMMGSLAGLAASRQDELLDRALTPLTFSPDGKQLSTTMSATVWDTVAGTPRAAPEEVQQLLSSVGFAQAAWSADGKLKAHIAGIADAVAAAADRDRPAAMKPDIFRVSQVLITDVAADKIIKTIPLGISPKSIQTEIGLLAFNTHGLVVQYCFDEDDRSECRVKTFDPASGKQLRDLKPNETETQGLLDQSQPRTFMSPNGRFLISTSMEVPKVSGASRFRIGRSPSMPTDVIQPYTIRGTDVQTGKKVWEFEGQIDTLGGVPALTFTAGDTILAVVTLEKERWGVRLCDTTTGRVLRTIDAGTRTIQGMTFSRDGSRIALTFLGESQGPAYGKPRPARSESEVAVHDMVTGRQIFALTHDTAVGGVAFAPDGRLIATTAEDRNHYVWNADTGELLATLVNLDVLGTFGSTEWLVVTPDGLFDGSPGAWQQIMWRFSQNTFDVGPVEIFFNELYYPGLAGEIFGGRRPRAPRALQQIDRRQPKLTVTGPAGETAARRATLRVEIADAAPDATRPVGSGAKDVRLFRNGTLVKTWRGDVLNGQATATLEASVTVGAGENHFTAYAFNRENVKSVDASFTVVGSQALARKGTAYVLAVGVNQYENAEYNLKFAVADATAFAGELKTQQAKLKQFDRVEVIELLDGDATKANLLLALKRLAGNTVLPPAVPSALARLSPAQPEDAVFIYFAGHGTARGARFYLVPHDLGYRGARASLDASAVETILGRSVSDLELEAAVEGLDAGSLVLVVDACNSGQALEAEEKRRGPMNSKGLAQLAYEKGMYILTAAQSYQAALETSQLGHGYLTFTLVEEGLKQTLADRSQKDGLVSVREWFDYATTRVPELQQSSTGSRLLLAMDERPASDNPIRHLQSPRAFYRSGDELFPLIVGKRQ